MGRGISSVECRQRFEEIKHEKRRSGAWAAEESEALLVAIEKHGDKKWWKVRLAAVLHLRRARTSEAASPEVLQGPSQAISKTCHGHALHRFLWTL
jgi:hypothetical protein